MNTIMNISNFNVEIYTCQKFSWNEVSKLTTRTDKYANTLHSVLIS